MLLEDVRRSNGGFLKKRFSNANILWKMYFQGLHRLKLWILREYSFQGLSRLQIWHYSEIFLKGLSMIFNGTNAGIPLKVLEGNNLNILRLKHEFYREYFQGFLRWSFKKKNFKEFFFLFSKFICSRTFIATKITRNRRFFKWLLSCNFFKEYFKDTLDYNSVF